MKPFRLEKNGRGYMIRTIEDLRRAAIRSLNIEELEADKLSQEELMQKFFDDEDWETFTENGSFPF